MSEPRFRFASTEQAEACGLVMTLTAFPELVREYFATQKELASVQFEIAGFGGGGERMDRCVLLATRQQLQREAIEAFLTTTDLTDQREFFPPSVESVKSVVAPSESLSEVGCS